MQKIKTAWAVVQNDEVNIFSISPTREAACNFKKTYETVNKDKSFRKVKKIEITVK